MKRISPIFFQLWDTWKTVLFGKRAEREFVADRREHDRAIHEGVT